MKKFATILLLFIAVACNRNQGPEDIQAKLKSTLLDYMYSRVNYDSTKVKYYVIGDVIYYDDPQYYICDFKVNMKIIGVKDTVGIKRLYITHDFKVISR
ncbi:hypothetical protein FRZ67_03850 [Panacibacter ginsenosidivorans]|uniref:Uncharacterized protein n=1 Tax=Panacibacter ginsenosidivorans TaxID=1813871 RepID=A0A5B8V7W5_9BACT|nr:hypothetical protein [Panacibacter ginsenosidivorans]QEC66468.1 hypothetical protein FRZ67_03850 [Panacibacter ginsenosidivorans]